jgi:hypothetical protein
MDPAVTFHGVAVVVEPEFGDKLLALGERIHVWVIGTPVNRASAEALWRNHRGGPSLDRGATTFAADPADPRDEVIASMLDTIDLHHGPYSHTPPWSVLEVYGTSPTPSLVAALAEFGFTDIAPTTEGFRASRTGKAPTIDDRA